MVFSFVVNFASDKNLEEKAERSRQTESDRIPQVLWDFPTLQTEPQKRRTENNGRDGKKVG